MNIEVNHGLRGSSVLFPSYWTRQQMAQWMLPRWLHFLTAGLYPEHSNRPDVMVMLLYFERNPEIGLELCLAGLNQEMDSKSLSA